MMEKLGKNLLLTNKFMNLLNAGLLGYGLINKDYFSEKTYDVNFIYIIHINI